MKKLLISIIAILVVLVPTVSAKQFEYFEYEKLNIVHSFVVGDYIFDVSAGYSPSLKDFMHASRTIPTSQEVYVYEIMLIDLPALSYRQFSMTEIYSKRKITDPAEFYRFNSKYVYRTYIDKAKNGDYDNLD